MKGLHVEGTFFKEDGTQFTYEEFIKLIESNRIEFGGSTCIQDDEGNFLNDDGVIITDQVNKQRMRDIQKDFKWTKPVCVNDQKSNYHDKTNFTPIQLHLDKDFKEEEFKYDYSKVEKVIDSAL
ncbi:hypothetical protein QJS65_10285 [Bacillus altitudinis]|uniref:hypothetical protein n=1 Tax=Bacillus altitudinis TaxID=293387 RepID=UPI0024A918E0|nr:hypothetical protein [Bacillus altitudinis]WHF25238.1 hypothetical protein QJS65_10285 [Bacillus altitudinis]